YIAIQLAKGYRPTMNGDVRGTGLLAANSVPNGAQVYINGKLTTATDTTITLDPDEYDIEIKKDGFIPWKKKLTIEKELVAQTNALLFPAAPSLSPLTFTGATNAAPSPDGERIAFYAASASAQTKNGLYVLELSDNLLSLQRGSRQISREIKGFDLEHSTIAWSPDGSQLLVAYDGHSILLDPTRMNTLDGSQDATPNLPRVFSEWEEELYKRERTRLAKFPDELQRVATQSAVNVYFSPDDERIMYTATASSTLKDTLIPAIPASNTQPQERMLTVGGIYVYDRKEDRNFRIGTDALEKYALAVKKTLPTKKTGSSVEAAKNAAQVETIPYVFAKKLLATDLYSSKQQSLTTSSSFFKRLQGSTTQETIANFQRHYSSLGTHGLQWFPNSRHVMGIRGDMVFIKEYDNANETVLYSGPFSESFVFAWPNGSKLVLLTRLRQSQDNPPNLYAVTLK
ncbi:MAG TPA: PEGA domain-containing protein, partial [Patescibacteria group bacterium]|nr:PEGA domain-containing protein [Patescibacteria group bacterium]